MERTSPRAFRPFRTTPGYFMVKREPILQSIHLISASSCASPRLVTKLKTLADQFWTVMYWILAPLSATSSTTALKGAKIQYITVQNWSANVFNLVTKRGLAHEDAEIKWIDCNIGSRLTMKYPGVVLKGRKSRGEVLSIALANNGQHQDTGAKMIHAADETTSNIISKSISIGT